MSMPLSKIESSKPDHKDVLDPDTAILPGFALRAESELLPSLKRIAERSRLRNMVTPGRCRLSMAMTNCGRFGRITDRTGCRYDHIDLEMQQRWPDTSASYRELALAAAAEAGFPASSPTLFN